MNTINLTGQRDFALGTDALAFMQDAYTALENLAALGGTNYIVSGCVVNGTSVSSGWIVLGGKLVYFAGGSISTYVKLVTTTQIVTLGTLTREQTTYTAEFSASSGTLWATLNTNRLDNIQNITNRLNTAEDELLINENSKAVGVNIQNTIESVTNIIFAKVNKSTYNAGITFKFEFVSPGNYTDPEFQFNVALAGAAVGSKFWGKNSENGICEFEVTGTTPFKIKLIGQFDTGTKTVEATSIIPL